MLVLAFKFEKNDAYILKVYILLLCPSNQELAPSPQRTRKSSRIPNKASI